MSNRSLMLRGKVKDGLIVPVEGVSFPEGMDVEVTVLPLEFTPEERVEFECLQEAVVQSLGKIDAWEAEGDETR